MLTTFNGWPTGWGWGVRTIRCCDIELWGALNCEVGILLVLKLRIRIYIGMNVCRNACVIAMTVLHVGLGWLGMRQIRIIPMLVIVIGLVTRVMVLHELWVRASVYKRIISPL